MRHLRGTVLGPGGETLSANAVVLVAWGSGDKSPVELARTVSDERGRYELGYELRCSRETGGCSGCSTCSTGRDCLARGLWDRSRISSRWTAPRGRRRLERQSTTNRRRPAGVPDPGTDGVRPGSPDRRARSRSRTTCRGVMSTLQPKNQSPREKDWRGACNAKLALLGYVRRAMTGTVRNTRLASATARNARALRVLSQLIPKLHVNDPRLRGPDTMPNRRLR
jgi:hypothetical protein